MNNDKVLPLVKWLTMGLSVFSLSGCQLLSDLHTANASNQSTSIAQLGCVFDSSVTEARENRREEVCNPVFWIEYWTVAVDTPWKQRQQQIKKLSQSVSDELKYFILSQPLDTPYQDRLRAQTRFEKLQASLQPAFKRMLENIAVMPSQQLLEYESAISLLSGVNARQTAKINEQAQLLQEQEQKINQLLNIEASMLDKARSEN